MSYCVTTTFVIHSRSDLRGSPAVSSSGDAVGSRPAHRWQAGNRRDLRGRYPCTTAEDRADATGSVFITKEAEVEEGDAFRALLYVTRDVADTVDHAISAAHVQDRAIGVELDVAIDGLPEDRGLRVRFCAEDVDLAICGEVIFFGSICGHGHQSELASGHSATRRSTSR